MKTTDTSIRVFVAATLAGCAFFMSTMAYADSGSTLNTSSAASSENTTNKEASGSGINILPGEGTVVVEQKNGSGSETIGNWTLIQPNNQQKESAEPTTVIAGTSAGTYTIFTHLPTGASSTIRIYRNGTLENLYQRPQASFVMQAGDTIKVVIHYTITRTGLVSVDSNPQGLTFTMKGPNSTTFSGTTPASFPGVAEGQYQVIYDNLKGCNIPAAKSLKLQAGSRISFTVYLSCAMADKLRERESNSQNNENGLSIGMGATSSIIRDVKQEDWFAPYVANVVKYGILGGYKNEAGEFTGQFGPGNNVTAAELAKAAHKIAGLSADAFTKTMPENVRARDAWYSPFIASAESRGWTIFNDAGINPNRPATRAEVLVTLLQALDKPLTWQKGDLFTDVTMRTKYAAAIETAATAKVVEGRKDADGKDLHQFGPTDPINRAEFSKILSRMIEVYKVSGAASSSSKK